MNCPDCKIPMDLLKTMAYGEKMDEEVWKCPKCKIEVESEE